jgi:aerobic-type carbon monoxide dehydrogenase small subunit (CoxS/CutS family)
MEPQHSHKILLKINGNLHPVEIDSTGRSTTFSEIGWILPAQESLRYGGCGSCTVLMDGGCLFLLHLGGGGQGKEHHHHRRPWNSENLHPLQKSFALS